MRKDKNFYKYGITKYHILEYIRRYAPERGVTREEIQQAFGVYRQYANYMLKKLSKMGLVDAIVEGKTYGGQLKYRFFITQRAYDLLKKYNAKSFFDENFLPFHNSIRAGLANGMKPRPTVLYA